MARGSCRKPDAGVTLMRSIRAMATTPRGTGTPQAQERDASFTTLSGDPIAPLYTAAVQMNTDPSTFDVLGRRYFLRANLKF